MKKNVLVLTLGLVLLMFSQVYGAIEWQGDYYAFGYFAENPYSGSFYVPPTTYYPSIGGAAQSETKSSGQYDPFDSVIRLTNQVPNNQGGSFTAVTFEAGANGPIGGTNPEDGVQAQGYLTVDFGNFNESIHGLGLANQRVSSYIVRNIKLDEDGAYNIDAFFSGPIDFTAFNYDDPEAPYGAPYHAEYQYEAEVSLIGYTRPQGWDWQYFDEMASFSWDDTTGDRHDVVTLLSEDEEGNDITYQLKVRMYLNNDVSNAIQYNITDSTGLPDFQNAGLGTESNPLTVTATLTPSQTPVEEPPVEQKVGFCDTECQATAPVQVSSGQMDIGFYYTRPVNILAGVISKDFGSVWWLTPDCRLTEDFDTAATNNSSLSCSDVPVSEGGSNGYIFWLVSESDLGTLDWENGIYELLFHQI